MRRVIDVHVHLYPPRRLSGLLRWIRREIPGHPVPEDVGVPRIVADLEEAGIELFFGVPFPLAPGEARELNRFNAALALRYAGLVPFGTVHPDDADAAAVVEEALGDLGLKGIKLHPMMMGLSAGDRRLDPVLRAAAEAGVPVLLHTGFEEGYGREPEREAWRRLLTRHPGVSFILAHAFFPDLPFAFSLLDRLSNVHLDLANVVGLLRWPAGRLPFGISRPAWGPGELRDAVEAHRDRVLFGSDHPAGMGTVEETVSQVASFGLEKGTVERVLYGNARDLVDRLRLA